MRRAMLLIFGFGIGGMALLALIWWVKFPDQGIETIGVFHRDGFYPHSVMGTDLLAVNTVRYDGPFWEDGSNEMVYGVAGLVVENQSGLLVAGGAVILETEEDRLVFEISLLPPGGKVLVLEKERRSYTQETPIACYGWTKEEYPENPGLIAVEAQGLHSMTLTNHTGCTVPRVEVQYKNYDWDAGMFMGGISYCVEETDLMPREVRLLNPESFSVRESRIVLVLQEMDR